jgi:hypothetical protein
LPVSRRDDNNGALALRITNDGLAAIRADEPPVEANDASKGTEAADAFVPEAVPAPQHEDGCQQEVVLPEGNVKYADGNSEGF